MKNKRQTIRSDCKPRGVKRYHYTRKNGSWKPKKPFETKAEALSFIKKYKMFAYVAYLCPECNKWHIGSNKILQTLKLEKQ